MTASGQRMSAENVAAPNPTQGTGAAQKPELPKGWGSFRSKPSCESPARWYATAPWNAYDLMKRYGKQIEGFWRLDNMVSAKTVEQLVVEVQNQVDLHARLMAEVADLESACH